MTPPASPDVREDLDPEVVPSESEEGEPLLFSSYSLSRSASPSPTPLQRPPVDAPASPPPSKAPRFKFSYARPKTPGSPPSNPPRFMLNLPVQAQSPGIPIRPNFILPPSDDVPSLGDAPMTAANGALVSLLLSPRKRGQRFVAGGMAATVRDWVLDMTNSIPATGNGTQKRRDPPAETYTVRISVEEAVMDNRQGWILVRGPRSGQPVRIEGDGTVPDRENWILIGAPSSMGSATGAPLSHSKPATEMQNGAVVGILPPTWNVEIGDETWNVGARWEILDAG